MSRKTTYWFHDSSEPEGGRADVDVEWEDPTFDEVCEGMDEPDEQRPVGRALSEGLRQLTEKQRFVIDRSWGLSDGQVYSFRKIANAMGIDVSAVKRHYDAGMKKLRQQLGV